jgi:hypothetical protein
MAASATGGGQSRELRRKLSLERRVASRRRRPRTLPLGRLRPPPPAEERSCATYTYIVKPRLIVARFHNLKIVPVFTLKSFLFDDFPSFVGGADLLRRLLQSLRVHFVRSTKRKSKIRMN